jgi:hypothetical protein
LVKASVSYALAAGSQIEMLRTTSDKGIVGKGSPTIPLGDRRAELMPN